MSPDSGMALGIMIAMILIVSVPGVIVGAIGYVVGRKRDDGKGAVAFGCGGFVLGAALGVLGVVVTFYEDTFEPTLDLQLPADFAHNAIIVIEDPSVSTRLDWNTTRTEATLVVPSSGVVRVATLEEFSMRTLDAELHGRRSTTGSSRPAPPGLAPATVIKCAGFGTSNDCDREDIEELIREREGS